MSKCVELLLIRLSFYQSTKINTQLLILCISKHLFSTLFIDEKEEIEANAERLICRCLTVEVSVTTPRNDIQEKALQRTKEILQNLKGLLIKGKQSAVDTAKSYLNACSSEPEGRIVDHRFQGIILECTADDQKMIRKKLKEMIKSQENCPEENGVL